MKSDKSCPILVADLAKAVGDVVFTPEWKALDGLTKMEILRYWRDALTDEDIRAKYQWDRELKAKRAERMKKDVS